MGQRERKIEVVKDYLRGGVSLRELEGKYGINFRTIHRWVKEAEAGEGVEEAEERGMRRELTAKRGKVPPPKVPPEMRDLQRELEEARLYNELLNAMIDIAEEQMGIKIRKKPGAKQR